MVMLKVMMVTIVLMLVVILVMMTTKIQLVITVTDEAGKNYIDDNDNVGDYNECRHHRLTRQNVREEDVSLPAAEHSILPLINELWALHEVGQQHIEGLEVGCLGGDHLKHRLLDLPLLAADLV